MTDLEKIQKKLETQGKPSTEEMAQFLLFLADGDVDYALALVDQWPDKLVTRYLDEFATLDFASFIMEGNVDPAIIGRFILSYFLSGEFRHKFE